MACVVGELKRHLRETSWRLHVPRPLKEQARRLSQAADELHQRLGRSPIDQPVGNEGDGSRVGYSQMHISRLQRRALARMRAQLVEP